ncbi:aminopeptidase [Nocardiopsis rhodophaea]|uniref:aminopeptidase n=2 Tax=Nocardiopsis rhodophaea TaxID=280238 RepID=UPI0031CEF6A1
MTPRKHPLASWRATTLAALTASALALTPAPASAGPRPADATPAPADDGIVERLEAIPGLRIVEERDTEPGFRFFVLGYEQPTDHGDPDGATFEQRLTLLHRGLDRPMVLHTTGYNVPDFPFRAEPTRIVDGNQISTEQRFFEPSRPDPADWSKLDIEQAAADHHRIVDALDDIYSREWLSTGASKGGMTSVYHRRFYPDDIDGTIAYVAPNDVRDHEDSAYLEFFDGVGADPACQQSLADLQRESLERRDELVGHYERRAAAEGWTFDRTLGSADAAFEMLVVDTPWAFWQYQPEARCAQVPATDASTAEIAAFLDDVAGFEFYSDQGTAPYVTYYFQAATQLGSPTVPTGHIDDLLRYPDQFGGDAYVPDDIPVPAFDRRAMPDIDHWVYKSSERMLFVDGEFDPWGAEAFRVRSSRRDTMRFVAPGANHGADIARLGNQDRAAATAAVRRWAGVADEVTLRRAPVASELDAAGDALRQQRRHHP